MTSGALPEAVGQTRADAAYLRLRDDIIAGVREGGEWLRIERLSKAYSSGPTPLREALQRLRADGLVNFHGNRGFSVAPLDVTEFEDLNVARTVVELEALSLSMRHGDDEWEASIVGAAFHLAKHDAALNVGGALDAWENANTAFHSAIVSACGSRWLLKLRQQMNDQFERYRRASIGLRHEGRDLAAEHAAIQTAVLNRDETEARRLVRDHFERTADTLTKKLRIRKAD